MVEQVDKFTPIAVINKIKDIRNKVNDVKYDPKDAKEWKVRIEGIKMALAWLQVEVITMAFDPERHSS